MAQFHAVTKRHLTRPDLERLFDGTAGILRIPDFLDRGQLERALSSLTRETFVPYDPIRELGGGTAAGEAALAEDLRSSGDPDGSMRRLGISLYEFTCRGAGDEYFARVPAASADRARAFEKSDDPTDHFIEALRMAWGSTVEVAFEPGLGHYFVGTIRDVHGESRIHTDDSREEAPDYSVGRVGAQLAANLFLTAPSAGSALVVFDRETFPADSFHRSGYGFSPAAVVGASFVGVTPRAGDLLLFPARNLHRLEPCEPSGSRIMLSIFIGREADHTLVCWS